MHSSPRRPLGSRVRDEHGIALIIALMATTLMMALGIALLMTTMTEGKIAANYRDGTEALYAADAAVERVMQDILTVPNWDNILNGTVSSAFIDGPASGQRTLPDGSKLDLTEATNLLRCGHVGTCTVEEMNAVTLERPWGENNPRWQLYAYGPMTDMLPTESINSNMYVIVWVADDPSENDCNPGQDGLIPACGNDAGKPNPGRGVLAMVAQAYGPGGVQRTIEVTIARTDTTEIERGYTGQRGQDEQNRRARKAAVQTPGKALTRSEMSLETGGLVTQ
jgi:hypothetical protein